MFWVSEADIDVWMILNSDGRSIRPKAKSFLTNYTELQFLKKIVGINTNLGDAPRDLVRKPFRWMSIYITYSSILFKMTHHRWYDNHLVNRNIFRFDIFVALHLDNYDLCNLFMLWIFGYSSWACFKQKNA